MLRKILKRVIPAFLKRKYNAFLLKRTRNFENRPIDEVFTDIYKKNYWKGEQSVSGSGSDLRQVKEIISQLPVMIRKHNVRSLLDIPCGDFHWMKLVDLPDVSYTGADIVPQLIDENKNKYGSGNRSFQVLDLTTDAIPVSDMIFCRDCLVHLSFDAIDKAIKNIKSSGSKYLLTTSFPSFNENFNIETGNWRPLNLQHAPFNWPAPIEILNERCTEGNGAWADKSLLLWKVEDIKPITN